MSIHRYLFGLMPVDVTKLCSAMSTTTAFLLERLLRHLVT